MYLSDFLTTNNILPSLKSTSKKQVLQEMAAQAARLTNLDKQVIFSTLLQREHLGSTAIGQGIAIPHGTIADLSTLTALFARLDRPINFDAPDNRSVDLIFLLLAPKNAGADHLKALAKITRILRDRMTANDIRACADAASIHALLTRDKTSNAA